MVENENTKRVFLEGIKERIEAIAVGDIFYNYGVSIATGDAKFDLELMKNPTELIKVVPGIIRIAKTSRNLDW